MRTLNDTHDPELKSWVTSSNLSGSDFPIQNLPFGVCKGRDNKERPLGCIAIGDQILALSDCLAKDLLTDKAKLAAEAAKRSANELGPSVIMGDDMPDRQANAAQDEMVPIRTGNGASAIQRQNSLSKRL